MNMGYLPVYFLSLNVSSLSDHFVLLLKFVPIIFDAVLNRIKGCFCVVSPGAGGLLPTQQLLCPRCTLSPGVSFCFLNCEQMETELEESRCLVVGGGHETRGRRLGTHGKDESG